MHVVIFLAETIFLLSVLYIGRNFLRRRIVELFSDTKTPPLFLFGFRFLLGALLLEELYSSYFYGNTAFIKPSSFFMIDPIFQLFFHSDYTFLILVAIPLVFVAIFIFEWKPRLTSAVVFL